MHRKYFISMSATNRFGIHAAVTTALAELGANLCEANQSVVGDFFVMSVLAEFPEQRPAQVIRDHLTDVCRPFGMTIVVKDPSLEPSAIEQSSGHERFFLTMEGADAPGWLRNLCRLLARESVDVNELFAKAIDGNRFLMVLELGILPHTDSLELQQELDALVADHDLTIALQHEDFFSASSSELMSGISGIRQKLRNLPHPQPTEQAPQLDENRF